MTIIPLLSQLNANLTDEEIKALTHRIQFGGDEVVKAKAGKCVNDFKTTKSLKRVTTIIKK